MIDQFPIDSKLRWFEIISGKKGSSKFLRRDYRNRLFSLIESSSSEFGIV
jgi:hypothetical protein